MTRLSASLVILVLSLGAARALRAQARSAGSVELDQRIYTKVYIAVGDALAPPFPIQDVRVLLVSARMDTIRLTTDGAGATTALVPRGQYQLLTIDWVSTGGREYRWSMPVTIGPGMRDIVLTERNAAAPARPAVAERPRPVGPPLQDPRPPTTGSLSAPTVIGARRTFVDSNGVGWEVFEQDFSRAATAGTDLPLPSVLVVLTFDREDETRQLDHFPANWRALPDSALAFWLAKAKRIRP